MELLYFHGGPGFNSNPEKNLLQAEFERVGMQVKFWNEPSTQRPEEYVFMDVNAFQHYLNSAEDFLIRNYQNSPLVLIGHSFGCHCLLYLSVKHPEKMKTLFFISPDLSLMDTDLNLFKLITGDYKKNNDEKALNLEEVTRNYTGEFDENTEKGYMICIENPRLFNYYWFNQERMKEFIQYYSVPGFGIDIDGFLKVRRSLFNIPANHSAIPAITLFGKNESIISPHKEKLILKNCYSNFSIYEFENSAHYPHIEETEKFIEFIKSQIVLLA